MSTLKFLDHHIHTSYQDGQWWIALKPICEALQVQWNWQYQRLQKHHFYSQLYRKPDMTGADGKCYSMVALPLRYVFLWIGQLNGKSQALRQYQIECADVLHDHFYPQLAARAELLREDIRIEVERKEVLARLSDNIDYLRLEELNTAKRSVKTRITASLKAEATTQATLFN